MDAILINPHDPLTDANIFDSVLNRVVEMIPLGIIYIATVLKKNGYDVEVIDFNTVHNQSDREKILRGIVEKKPKTVGFSAMTPYYPDALELAAFLRRELPRNCRFVWGGYHVSFLPGEVLSSGMADVVVRGEGEYVMLQLMEAFRKNPDTLPVDDIPGISYMKDGVITHNDPGIVRINALDNLPFPDRNLIDYDNYSVPATIIASRGCVGNCQFCAAGSWGQVQVRSVKNITAEIESVLSLMPAIKHIFFVDNCFIGQKDRLKDVLVSNRNKGINITYSMEARVSNVNEELLKIYSEHNVLAIQFGVESGSADILAKIRKGITLSKVLETVELCIKNRIIPYCSFIIGHPFDTEDTINETIEFAKKLKRTGAEVGFSVLTPYPGTDIYNKREELGISILDWNYEHWDARRTVIKTRNLTRRTLTEFFKKAVLAVRSL